MSEMSGIEKMVFAKNRKKNNGRYSLYEKLTNLIGRIIFH